MSKVFIFLAQGFEEVEALTAVDLLRREGIDVQIVSISESKQVTGARNIQVIADKLLSEINFDEADMLILPGGQPGTRNLEACTVLMNEVNKFVSSNKYVAAICAAPTILGHKGLLVGKKACCYPGLENELEGAQVLYDSVCVSDNIITSRGVGTALDFALKLVAIFTNDENSKKLSEKIVY